MADLGKPTFPSNEDPEEKVDELSIDDSDQADTDEEDYKVKTLNDGDESGSESGSESGGESGDEGDEYGDEGDEYGDEGDEDEMSATSEPTSETSETQPPDPNLSFADSDEDNDDDDDDYLQKLEKDMQSNFLEKYHPETAIHNYDEVKKLSKVTRDENGIIVDPLHKTLPFLTKYEKTRILGQRAKQINSGAKPFVQVKPDVLDGYLIAQEELKIKAIPFIIRRPLPGGGFEYWSIKDLDLI